MAPVNGGQVGGRGRRRRGKGTAGASGHGSVTARPRVSVSAGLGEARKVGRGGAMGGVEVHVSARIYAKGGARVKTVRRKRIRARGGAGVQGKVGQRGVKARGG